MKQQPKVVWVPVVQTENPTVGLVQAYERGEICLWGDGSREPGQIAIGAEIGPGYEPEAWYGPAYVGGFSAEAERTGYPAELLELGIHHWEMRYGMTVALGEAALASRQSKKARLRTRLRKSSIPSAKWGEIALSFYIGDWSGVLPFPVASARSNEALGYVLNGRLEWIVDDRGYVKHVERHAKKAWSRATVAHLGGASTAQVLRVLYNAPDYLTDEEVMMIWDDPDPDFPDLQPWLVKALRPGGARALDEVWVGGFTPTRRESLDRVRHCDLVGGKTDVRSVMQRMHDRLNRMVSGRLIHDQPEIEGWISLDSSEALSRESKEQRNCANTYPASINEGDVWLWSVPATTKTRRLTVSVSRQALGEIEQCLLASNEIPTPEERAHIDAVWSEYLTENDSP